MWIFQSPKDYSEMVEKISKSLFFLTALLLYCLSCMNKEFDAFLIKLSFGAKYDFSGLKLNLAIIYIPIGVGILEHMFKIHDVISNILRIRRRYDKKYIIESMLNLVENSYDEKKLNKDTVEKLMGKCFYKYTSSTCPKIDQHNIVLALNEWCWFWILLDSLAVVVILGICFILSVGSLSSVVSVIVSIVIILLLMLLVKQKIKKYTSKEISAILANDEAKKEIKQVFTSALSD